MLFRSDALKRFEAAGVLAVEMETSGLYTLAAQYGRKALTIATVSDMIDPHAATTAEERETGFSTMIEIALEAAFPS